MADIKKKFGVRLFQLRSKAGMTQDRLAEKANLSIDSIRRIEKGSRSPSFDSLERIADALGVDLVELFRFEGKEYKMLADATPEVIKLWGLLKGKKRDKIKKICDLAKIVLE